MALNQLTLLAFALTLLGCNHGPSRPKAEDIHEDRTTFAATSTYSVEPQTPGLPIEDHWLNGSRRLDITFWAPEASGKYPLIVYLPGLGQDSDAAPLWREAWVKAGYAVLAVQRGTDAKALNNLSAADQADLKSIGHDHFNAANLEGRVADAIEALRVVEERSRSGKSPYSSAETAHWVLAGFDLGAQTVQAILGENVKSAKLPSALPQPMAAILLSPHVDLSKGGMQHRFERIKSPLLVITGTDDHDPWGMTAPSVRVAPWQQSQSGEKYLLTLTNGTHRQLAGIDPLSAKPEDQEMDPDALLKSEEESMASNHPAPGGKGNSAVPGRGRATQFGDARRGFGLGYDPHHYGHQLAIIETVSTAFLNAQSRNDARARAWLTQGAKSWIGTAAELRVR